MKIAIHQRRGSFSDNWLEYCKINKIDYKIVNCYDTSIMKELEDCDGLMWHHTQNDYRDMLFAKQLLFSVQQSGKKVFPDYFSNWHFDDKVGQKYLFESIKAPLVPSYVFYSKREALSWIESTTFPKVFKLRGGAGSANVKLVKNKKEAKYLIKKAFNKGFSQIESLGQIRERIRLYKEKKASIIHVLKGFARFFIKNEFVKMYHKEKGYIYFQDYIKDNKFDIRIIIIGDRAFAIKRMVRNNDFRASGSGNIFYEKDNFNKETIKLAFYLTNKINSKCAAFDFLYDNNNNPLIVEVSYGFNQYGYIPCPGYWDINLNWFDGSFTPEFFILDDFIKKLY